MSRDSENLAAYEDDFARQGSTEPLTLCACGAPADGLEILDDVACFECWLAACPDCSWCVAGRGTVNISEDFTLCKICAASYDEGESGPEDNPADEVEPTEEEWEKWRESQKPDVEPEPLPGDDVETGNPVGKGGAAW